MDEDHVMGEAGTAAIRNGDHVRGTVDPTMVSLNAHLKGKYTTEISPSPSTTTQDGIPDQDMIYTRPHRVAQGVMIPPAPKFAPLPYASSRTGVVYDARMRFHCEPQSMMVGDDDIHPEDPRRIHEIFQELREAGLIQGSDELDDVNTESKCWRIQARSATRGEVLLVHTQEHYEFIESLQGKSEQELFDLSDVRDSIYFHNSTFECARLAAGGAIEACRAVVRGDVRNALAIIRPPGHHAECGEASGFCIFNNVPIATRVCQNDFPEQCRKVLILDWDVHHGNGIQHIFYEDPNVLYISLHVYRDKQFYPNLPDGNLDYCGQGPGLGKNVNIPWAEHGMGDAEYLYAFQEVVVPIATEFDPDLVIISAGFDAAEGDMLGGCHVSPAGYAHMTHMLMRLAKGKIAVCLEGGYNLRSIARSALAVTRTLMLQPPDRLAEDLGPPAESAIRTIAQVKQQQSRYWKSIYPKKPDTGVAPDATLRLHEVIREWQAKLLSEAHQMIPLAIRKSGITQTFEYNVLATPRFTERHPLLVIFHDPPEIMNRPDPITGKVELHNIWLTDMIKKYIDWAITEGFQVIDVNVPKVVTVEDENETDFQTSDSADARATQTRMLANYLWENYIEPHDATQVFFLGIGAPYSGLVDLLSMNENTTEEGISHVIGFIADTALPSIKRATNDFIPGWFYEHSMIFVAHDHNAWDPARVRKPSRRRGKLRKSSHRTLNSMLEEHFAEVTELLVTKKREYDEEHSSENTEEESNGFKSPPPFGGVRMAIDTGGRSSATPLSPRAPQLGLFSTQSPRSPMKRGPP
ncbi:hypothetical protein M011DRAFT_470372 [Sporormia fimetaria CBS 119925]|uniref:Histone deacetylase n=1 Tax=Sporormia fimetaria CBS 119925 TaxID=1340428 RepID=A0A6A6V1W8_9PLEO|nr:hypothetical protein M011DRAFT_470372 [Sporormia fimetaria CBS 119925]